MNQASIKEALLDLTIPDSDFTLGELNAIKKIELQDNTWHIDLSFGCAVEHFAEPLTQAITERLTECAVTVTVRHKINPHQIQSGLKPVAGVSNIIAVASGKGGVGKSTVSVNLALALQQEGARVGILDADIYGPNQPHMLGAMRHPETDDGKHMKPVISHGLQSMSIGYLIEQDTAMIWRGPMVTGALMQMLNDTQWDNLDYLILDLPPGTGDIQLTMAQKIPVAASVVVTTPQDIALQDVRRAVTMFNKVNVPILGVVENMSVYHCPQCGHEEAIFGEQGGRRLCDDFNLNLLAKIPLHKRFCELSDRGTPLVSFQPESHEAHVFVKLARRVGLSLSQQAKTYAHKFPQIVVTEKTD